MPMDALRAALARGVTAAGNAIDVPMRALQRVLGVPRIAWMFVAPNLVILGLFTFLPIVIDFYFAFTGGVELYPSQRPFVGGENFATLFECGNYLDPFELPEGHLLALDLQHGEVRGAAGRA